MKITSINQTISDRPGFDMATCSVNGSFFVIDYRASDSGKRLQVYFNQDGKEVFAVEED